MHLTSSLLPLLSRTLSLFLFHFRLQLFFSKQLGSELFPLDYPLSCARDLYITAMSILLPLSLIFSMISYSNAVYCVCKDGNEQVLQKAIDFACGAGADCTQIQQNGACFQPNTVKSHCDIAVNSYFQKKASSGATCDFNGAATTSQSPPSTTTSSCLSGSGSSGTPSTGTPTTGTPTTGTPSTGTPSTGTPTTGMPSTGTPTTGTPTTGMPSTGTPTTGVPTTGNPSTGFPNSGTPSNGGMPTSSSSSVFPGTTLGPTGSGLGDPNAGETVLVQTKSTLLVAAIALVVMRI